MSSWTVLDRTDNTLTIVIRRRKNDEKKSSSKKKDSDSTRTPSKKSSKKRKNRRNPIDNEKLDEDTENALRSIREINKYLKHKYEIKSNDFPKSKSKTTVSTSNSSTTFQTTSSSSEDVADKMYREVARIPKISEAVDHKGYPLSHPLATTPFPGATTAAQREKARQMLRNLGKQQAEQEALKSTKSKSSKSTKSKSKPKKSKSKLSTKSSKSIEPRNSTKKDACKNCHTCSECTRKCIENHMVTEEDRIKFRHGISKLRKDIQRPEKKRQTNNTKSPYDQTQSVSETSISLSK